MGKNANKGDTCRDHDLDMIIMQTRSVIKNVDRGYTCRDQDLDMIIMQTMNDSPIHNDRNEYRGYTLHKLRSICDYNVNIQCLTTKNSID